MDEKKLLNRQEILTLEENKRNITQDSSTYSYCDCIHKVIVKNYCNLLFIFKFSFFKEFKKGSINF